MRYKGLYESRMWRDDWLKVLGIVCSPRKGKNTEILVREALSGAEAAEAEVELVRVADLNLSPCDGCRSCRNSGECWIEDDMQNVYEKLVSADGILMGSPVYFWSVSGQAKIFIDRTLPLNYPSPRLKNKVGGAIAVAGRRGCVNTLSIINNFFLGHGMCAAELGVACHGGIEKDKQALERARALGTRLCELIDHIKPQTP